MALTLDEVHAVARSAARRAEDAVDHTLNLHESLGKLTREVTSSALKTHSELARLARRIDDGFSKLDGAVRDRLASVPELVDEEITAHGQKRAAAKWKRVRSVGWKALTALAIGAGAGLGAFGHWLLETLLH